MVARTETDRQLDRVATELNKFNRNMNKLNDNLEKLTRAIANSNRVVINNAGPVEASPPSDVQPGGEDRPGQSHPSGGRDAHRPD